MSTELHNTGRLEATEGEAQFGSSYLTIVGTKTALARVLNVGMRGLSMYDARRLAAAWNFCEGIPTAELEKAGDVANFATSKTLLTGITTGAGNATAGFEGGACKLLAASFAEQFVTSGALNYLEVHLDHESTGPLLVTLQRKQGKTPDALRREAERDHEQAMALLRTILTGSLGDSMRLKLENGQSTNTEEGKAWCRAFNLIGRTVEVRT